MMPEWIRNNFALIALVVVVAGGWLALRTSATSFAPGTSLETVLADDEPVVLEFFGNT